MCGIVGYAGGRDVVPVLLNGLSRLEYRGYDSAGVAVISDNRLKIYKTKGRLSALCELMEGCCPGNTVGIGHTRWATHGEPSFENSIPNQLFRRYRRRSQRYHRKLHEAERVAGSRGRGVYVGDGHRGRRT